jgi:hypothetical protein
MPVAAPARSHPPKHVGRSRERGGGVAAGCRARVGVGCEVDRLGTVNGLPATMMGRKEEGRLAAVGFLQFCP